MSCFAIGIVFADTKEYTENCQINMVSVEIIRPTRNSCDVPFEDAYLYFYRWPKDITTFKKGDVVYFEFDAVDQARIYPARQDREGFILEVTGAQPPTLVRSNEKAIWYETFRVREADSE